MQIDQPAADLALTAARRALEHDDLASAEAICLQLLQRHSDFAPALHLYALLQYRAGTVVGAIEHLMRAIELEPNRAAWLNDLGNMLSAHQQPEQAVKFFQHALMLEPGNAVIWNNLGAMRVKLNQPELAGDAFEQAVALDESLVDAWANYANWLTSQGREHDAAECVLRAFVAAPAAGQPLVMRGMALARLGRASEAADCFHLHLLSHPDDPTAHHLYHACARDAVPARASDDYIRAKYHEYADHFDTHQDELGSRSPELIVRALSALGTRDLTALDAGCGTGRVGLVIQPFCRTLTGVDLSGAMLKRAAARAVYQTLETCEITRYLAAHSSEFDLITAADLLAYFGALDHLCQHAFSALRAGGHLLATLEALPQESERFELQASGRYRHGEHYLTQCLSTVGFDWVDIEPQELRTEGEHGVSGWLLTAHKPLEMR